jgi:hypothetical protein
MIRIEVKILGIRKPQRYALRRTLTAAASDVKLSHPDFHIGITEIGEMSQMAFYTQVFVYPSLVINEKLVCTGRLPKREEIRNWLSEAASIDRAV